MYTAQSRIHQRWMGSHALIGLTLLADLVGIGLTYLAGGIVLPLIASVGVWLFQVLGVLVSHGVKALQPDLALYVCTGAGTLIGLLIALSIGGAFDSAYTIRRSGQFRRALLAFVCTLLAATICWILLAQFLHHTPILWPPAVTIPQSINTTWATIWAFYYVFMRALCWITAPAQALTMRGQSLYRYDLLSTAPPKSEAAPQSASASEQHLILIDQVSASAPPSFQASTPVSRAHPGGPKWGHIEQCYDLYRKALLRFDPPPFSLKTPDGFRYYDDGGGQQLYWYKHTLLIPKKFLDPQWRHALLPELARQLMYYNAPDLRVFEFLNGYPRRIVTRFFLLVTLNFLWLPILVKTIAGERWQGERVLDSDIYACKAGEAMRLRTRLRAEQEALQNEGLADGSFPTLDERIEQINAFINEEARQLRALGYGWDTSQKPVSRLRFHSASTNTVAQPKDEPNTQE